jgi:hypothetical protein
MQSKPWKRALGRRAMVSISTWDLMRGLARSPWTSLAPGSPRNLARASAGGMLRPRAAADLARSQTSRRRRDLAPPLSLARVAARAPDPAPARALHRRPRSAAQARCDRGVVPGAGHHPPGAWCRISLQPNYEFEQPCLILNFGMRSCAYPWLMLNVG